MDQDKICVACQCPPQMHAYFHECSLFDKKLVCIDCCRDTNVAEFLDNIKKRTTKEVAAEDVKTICLDAAHV